MTGQRARRRGPSCHGLSATLLAAVLATIPWVAEGQQVEGTVRDRQGGAPIPSATVVLSDTLNVSLVSVTSESDGTFRLKVERPGLYRIRIESLGYATAVSDAFTLDPLEELHVDLWLNPEPIGLAPLDIRSRRRPLIENGALQGFVDRRERGWGHFITRGEIEARNATTVSDILRLVSGVHVVKHPGRMNTYLITMGRAAPSLRSLSDSCERLPTSRVAACLKEQRDPEKAAQDLVTGGCPVVYYVDNVKVHSADYVTEILNLHSPSEIEAIEVYRGASETPAEFGGSDARCGVVVIWTRRGGL